MSIVVTGAGGFVGRGLVDRLLAQPGCPTLTLVDTQGIAPRPGIRCVIGSIADPAVLRDALAGAPRVVYHLASVPGGRAEQDYRLGRSVNLDATLAILEILAESDIAPVLVFASSIAVFGGPLPDPAPETQQPRPLLTYGAHKLMGEVSVADFARRGLVDGRSVRLSGIVARPAAPPGQAGAISIFLSDLIRDLPEGIPVTVPMSPGATTWLMSLPCCVDALLHAGAMTVTGSTDRVWTPPPVRTSIADLVTAIGAACGRDVRTLVHYAPQPAVEAAFGASPVLLSPVAEAAGFIGDGTIERLVARVRETVGARRCPGVSREEP